MDDSGHRPPEAGDEAPGRESAGGAATEFWDRVVEKGESVAAAYRDAGWDATELHPGETTPVPAMLGGEGNEEFGLSVLVPPPEYESVAEFAERAAFDGAAEPRSASSQALPDDTEVRRVGRGEAVYLVAAFRAPKDGRVVVVPAYYRLNEAASMLDRAASAGEMRVLVRSPAEGPVVLRDDDPDPWTPGEK